MTLECEGFVIGKLGGHSIAAANLNRFLAGIDGLGGMAGKDLDAGKLSSMSQ